MRCLPREVFASLVVSAAILSLTSVPSAQAGGVACRCEFLLSKLDPTLIPEELQGTRLPDEAIAAIRNGQRPITALAFLKYGQILAVAEGGPQQKGEGPAGRVRLYDLSGTSPKSLESLDVTTDYVSAFATHPHHPDQLIAASVRWDQRLQSWTQMDEKWVRQSEIGDFSDWWIKTATFSPDGMTLAAGSDGVRLLGIQEGKLRLEQALPGTSWAVSAIAFSHDGKQLMAGTGSAHFAPEDGELLVWSLEKSPPAVIARASVAKGDVSAIASLRTGQIITADQTGKLVFWTLSQAGELNRVREIHAHEKGVRSIYSVLGNRLISTGNDGTVALWDAETGQLLKRWTFQTNAAIATVAPSGKHVAVGLADGRVYVMHLP